MEMIVGLFLSYLRDMFFIFIFILIMINHIISYHKYRHTCSFANFLEYVLLFGMITWMKNVNNIQPVKVQSQCVA